MERDPDPREHAPERPALRRSGSGSSGRDVRHPDPRDVFVRALDLPRGRSRERVKVHTQTYTLRGSEVRTLANVGAFRVIPAEDLATMSGSRSDARTGRPLPPSRSRPHPHDPVLRRPTPNQPRGAHRTRARPAREPPRPWRRARAGVLRRRSEAARADPRQSGLSRVPTRGRTTHRAGCRHPPRRARLRDETRLPAVPPAATPGAPTTGGRRRTRSCRRSTSGRATTTCRYWMATSSSRTCGLNSSARTGAERWRTSKW